MALPDLNLAVMKPVQSLTAAATLTNGFLFRTPRKVTITAARFASNATITQHATDYVTARVKSGGNTIAYWSTVTSGDGTATVGAAKTMNLVSANLDLTTGSVIVLDIAKAGSGKAVTEPAIQLEWKYRE